VDADGLLHPIECKLTSRPDASDATGIRKLADFYGSAALGPATVACLAEARFEVGAGVTARPGWTVWDILR
jgi:hypothetical protein